MKLALLAAAVLALLLPVTARAHNVPGSRHNRVHAINHAFCGTLKPCPLGRQAVRVASCESGPNLSPYATNGVYWGAFQFGPYARAAFGFSWSIWRQARAAYRYWLEAGWSPWSCSPR